MSDLLVSVTTAEPEKGGGCDASELGYVHCKKMLYKICHKFRQTSWCGFINKYESRLKVLHLYLRDVELMFLIGRVKGERNGHKEAKLETSISNSKILSNKIKDTRISDV